MLNLFLERWYDYSRRNVSAEITSPIASGPYVDKKGSNKTVVSLSLAIGNECVVQVEMLDENLAKFFESLIIKFLIKDVKFSFKIHEYWHFNSCY